MRERRPQITGRRKRERKNLKMKRERTRGNLRLLRTMLCAVARKKITCEVF